MKDIIDMACEAGASPSHNPELWDVWTLNDKALERFADLIRAEEREACAELRHKLTPFDLYNRSEMLGVMNQGLDDYQQLIRARGSK
jgi:flagellar biosynthesis regulator FlaF